jgi:hypothetical protein
LNPFSFHGKRRRKENGDMKNTRFHQASRGIKRRKEGMEKLGVSGRSQHANH